MVTKDTHAPLALVSATVLGVFFFFFSFFLSAALWRRRRAVGDMQAEPPSVITLHVRPSRGYFDLTLVNLLGHGRRRPLLSRANESATRGDAGKRRRFVHPSLYRHRPPRGPLWYQGESTTHKLFIYLFYFSYTRALLNSRWTPLQSANKSLFSEEYALPDVIC